MMGHRTCTLCILPVRHIQLTILDSSFNLPPNVTIEYSTNSTNNVNLQPLQPGNNPQAGGLAPQAFKDVNLNTTADNDAVSGYVFISYIKLIFPGHFGSLLMDPSSANLEENEQWGFQTFGFLKIDCLHFTRLGTIEGF